MAASLVKGSLVNYDFPKFRLDPPTWAGYYMNQGKSLGAVGEGIINISLMLLGAQ